MHLNRANGADFMYDIPLALFCFLSLSLCLPLGKYIGLEIHLFYRLNSIADCETCVIHKRRMEPYKNAALTRDDNARLPQACPRSVRYHRQQKSDSRCVDGIHRKVKLSVFIMFRRDTLVTKKQTLCTHVLAHFFCAIQDVIIFIIVSHNFY